MAYDENYFRTRELGAIGGSKRELIQQRDHRDSKVLEIGCGGGGLMRMLRKRGQRLLV
jgi:cyclopropane fatty-acyl-phospholipid synthase-like methyltransferase